MRSRPVLGSRPGCLWYSLSCAAAALALVASGFASYVIRDVESSCNRPDALAINYLRIM
ncbi:MAG: hypothetical protein ACLPKI_24975 [Streptosporangiaceae bacterium]